MILKRVSKFNKFEKDLTSSLEREFKNLKTIWDQHDLGILAWDTVVVGKALATTATDGFLYIPTCAGTPTGVPITRPGTVPLIYDSTNNKLYIYNGGWKGGTVPGIWV